MLDEMIAVDGLWGARMPVDALRHHRAEMTVGCRKVRRPVSPLGSGASLRMRIAGVPMPPAART
jgi:hypothetical protein